MDSAEFDRFADEYRRMHEENTRAFGEDPEFFARYKVDDAANLFAHLCDRPAGRILDFGAGVGNSIAHFRRHFDDASIVGVDVSQKSLALAAERHPATASLVRFDGTTLPFADSTFDLAFSACVFHHIPADRHIPLFRELQRVLSPDGVLVVFEHNPLNPLTVRAVNTCPFDSNAELITAKNLRRKMNRAGLVDFTRHFRLFFPGPLRGLRPLERFMTWLPLGAQYFIAGRKQADRRSADIDRD